MRTIAALLAAAILFAGCASTSDGTDSKSASAPKSSAAATSTPKPKPAPKPQYTVAQKNAIKAAQNYLDLSGFSRAGLIEQLSSKAGDGFKRADAVFAVNHVKADWNKEAVQAAKAYLDTGSFSRRALIEQLSSSYGDRFTRAQAVYAANKVGL